MTQDPNFVLDNSLRAIDAARRRAVATFAFGWIMTFGALLWFTHVLRTTDDLERVISAAVVALVFAIFLGAFTVVLYVTRMTRRILRAIEIVAIDRSDLS